MNTGYFPGMATLSGMPIYFENRDGNMNVKSGQDELLERCFLLLSKNKISINRGRFDSGSYSQKIVNTIEKNCKLFYIRANRCSKLMELLKDANWEKVTINNKKKEVCSIKYTPFSHKKGNKKTHRLVVSREETGELQNDLFTRDNFKYRSILTNDERFTEKEVIEYYNQRGAEERVIDELNNDFGWKHMPFSLMEENTVFLILMMICKNIYSYFIAKVSKHFKGIEPTSRIKRFIFRFITVPVKWIKRGRYYILRIFSEKPYELLPIYFE